MRPVTMEVDWQSEPKPGPNRDQNRDPKFLTNRKPFWFETRYGSIVCISVERFNLVTMDESDDTQ